MKRTNGTDHTIAPKDTLDQKLVNIYGKPSFEKKSDDRFKCIYTREHDDGDGYEYDDSTTDDDDEIYD